jgi:arylsulfatase A-like enzyme
MKALCVLRRAAAAGGITLLAACAADQSTVPGRSNAQAVDAQRPNIVYILADDLGYADLGVFGSEIPTPNLDALARGGMLLTDFYSGMSCAPTRAMVMSGMDNHQAGMGVQGAPRREEQKDQPGYEGFLNFRVASLAELMSDAGYNTYMTGKWHLGSTVETGPRARGFKRSANGTGGGRRMRSSAMAMNSLKWVKAGTPRATTRRR